MNKQNIILNSTVQTESSIQLSDDRIMRET